LRSQTSRVGNRSAAGVSSINACGGPVQKIALSTRIKALRSTPIVREQGLGSKRFSSRRIVRIRSRERPATSLGDQLQVPVALRRRGLCRGAWHCVRTWRHEDRRIRMTPADLTVDIVPIVGPASPGNDATVPGHYLEPSPFTLMERRPPLLADFRRASSDQKLKLWTPK